MVMRYSTSVSSATKQWCEQDRAALNDFKKTLSDRGFTISALSCHSNPLHPDKDVAAKHKEISRKTILLAEQLGVSVVIDFSGCPGDSFNSRQPNWVTCPWPPEYQKRDLWCTARRQC